MAGTGRGKDIKAVFLVRGRQEAAAQAMERFLRSIGLRIVSFAEAREWTGKPSPYIGEILRAAMRWAGAVLVLMTGDDEVRLRADLVSAEDPILESQTIPRSPRPNVIFEAGMAVALGPNQTVLVEFGRVKSFSDISGIHVVRMKSGSETERTDLANRLRDAGCEVEVGKDPRWLKEEFFVTALRKASARDPH